MNNIRKARQEFRKQFGDETYQVISRIACGWKNETIEDNLSIPKTSIAAYKANLTRGTYYPFAQMGSDNTVHGNCF